MVAWAAEDAEAYTHQRRLLDERKDLSDAQRAEAVAQLDAWLAGRELEAWRTRPVLGPDVTVAWEGFWDLEGDRAIGAMGGIGPLPFVARSMWLAEAGIPAAERRWYHDLWRRMDGVYVEHYNRRKDAPSAPDGDTTAGAGRG